MGGTPQQSPNENLFLGCQVGRMWGGRGGHEKFIRDGTPDKFKKIPFRGSTRGRIRGDRPRKSSVPFSLLSWWLRNGPSQHSQFDHGGRGVAQVSPEKKYHRTPRIQGSSKTKENNKLGVFFLWGASPKRYFLLGATTIEVNADVGHSAATTIEVRMLIWATPGLPQASLPVWGHPQTHTFYGERPLDTPRPRGGRPHEKFFFMGGDPIFVFSPKGKLPFWKSPPSVLDKKYHEFSRPGKMGSICIQV